jgi:putative sugar O-methyltransferase
MRAFAKHGELRFREDVRYDLRAVTEGFESRIDDCSDDTDILRRICKAYRKAVLIQETAAEAYKATEKWRRTGENDLRPVITALVGGDIPSLARMYRNFYRDPCSAGILGAPNGLAKAYFSGSIKDIYQKFYLGHVLYRLDYWHSITNKRYTIRDLAGPGIGNPFGVVLDGTHIGVGAEYAHYCSRRVSEQLDSGTATVAEIGGGFGGIAYYLLRDRPKTRYVDFDLPESVALTSYYLMKSFPQLRFLCYGEKALTRESLKEADVILLPRFELATMPMASVDLTFTSHGMSDASTAAADQLVSDISRMTAIKMLLIGNRRINGKVADIVERDRYPFKLVDTCESGWHSYKISGAGVGGAAGMADAAVVEQTYLRNLCWSESCALPGTSKAATG